MARGLVALLVLALLAAPSAAADGPAAAASVVVLVPSADAAVTRDLEDGLVLALEAARSGGGPEIVVERAAGAGTWSSTASAGVEAVRRAGGVALVGPPERAAAHALAQVATRVGLPLLTTSRAWAVTRAGSPWVFRVVAPGSPDADRDRVEGLDVDLAAPEAAAFVAAFRARHGRAPGPWAVAGHDAGAALAAALAVRGEATAAALRGALAGLPAVEGATGRFAFDPRGDRGPARDPAAPPADAAGEDGRPRAREPESGESSAR